MTRAASLAKLVQSMRRFASSFFGALLLHLTILLALATEIRQIGEEIAIIYIVFSLLASMCFALIISTGTKGGLIPRFWYGVSLPAI